MSWSHKASIFHHCRELDAGIAGGDPPEIEREINSREMKRHKSMSSILCLPCVHACLTTRLLMSWSLSLSLSCSLAMVCRSSTLLFPLSSLSLNLQTENTKIK